MQGTATQQDYSVACARSAVLPVSSCQLSHVCAAGGFPMWRALLEYFAAGPYIQRDGLGPGMPVLCRHVNVIDLYQRGLILDLCRLR